MKRFNKIIVTVFIILIVTCISVLPVFAAQVEGGQVGGNGVGSSDPNVTFYSWTKDQIQIGFTRENGTDFNLYSNDNTVTKFSGYTNIRNKSALISKYSDIEKVNNISVSTPTHAVTKDTLYFGIGPQYIGKTANFRMVATVDIAGYEIQSGSSAITYWPSLTTAYFYTNPDNLNDKFYIYDIDISHETLNNGQFQVILDYSFKITHSFRICGFFFNCPLAVKIDDVPSYQQMYVSLGFNISDIVLDEDAYSVKGGVESAIDNTIGRPNDPTYHEFNYESSLGDFESSKGELLDFYKIRDIPNKFELSFGDFFSLNPKLLSSMQGFTFIFDNWFSTSKLLRPLLQISLFLGTFSFVFGLAKVISSSVQSSVRSSHVSRTKGNSSHKKN